MFFSGPFCRPRFLVVNSGLACVSLYIKLGSYFKHGQTWFFSVTSSLPPSLSLRPYGLWISPWGKRVSFRAILLYTIYSYVLGHLHHYSFSHQRRKTKKDDSITSHGRSFSFSLCIHGVKSNSHFYVRLLCELSVLDIMLCQKIIL